MSRRGPMTALLRWLPVFSVIVALFVLPASNGAAQRASLNVTPGAGTYGGQQLTIRGDLGNSGEQRIWLQRRSSPTGEWSDVPNSTGRFTSNADGSFRFNFPAPAMNAVMFRVVSKSAATPSHTFKTVHQEAIVSVKETNPLFVTWPDKKVYEYLPRGMAVDGEPFGIAVNTSEGTGGLPRPSLTGRGVSLQQRQGDFSWTEIGTGNLGNNGAAQFGDSLVPGDGVYRIVLDDWIKGGDEVGWFPSLPFYFDLVTRPGKVVGLDAVETDAEIKLTWTLPADPDRAKILIVRGSAAGIEPTWVSPGRFTVAEVGGSAVQYVDRSGLYPNRAYRYAVYSVSADGVYSEAVRANFSTLPPPGRTGGEGR